MNFLVCRFCGQDTLHTNEICITCSIEYGDIIMKQQTEMDKWRKLDESFTSRNFEREDFPKLWEERNPEEARRLRKIIRERSALKPDARPESNLTTGERTKIRETIEEIDRNGWMKEQIERDRKKMNKVEECFRCGIKGTKWERVSVNDNTGIHKGESTYCIPCMTDIRRVLSPLSDKKKKENHYIYEAKVGLLAFYVSMFYIFFVETYRNWELIYTKTNAFFETLLGQSLGLFLAVLCVGLGGKFILRLVDNLSRTYSVTVSDLSLKAITWYYGMKSRRDNIRAYKERVKQEGASYEEENRKVI